MTPTAYQLRSGFLDHDTCATKSVAPSTLSAPFSVPIPTSVTLSTVYDEIARNSILHFLSLETCLVSIDSTDSTSSDSTSSGGRVGGSSYRWTPILICFAAFGLILIFLVLYWYLDRRRKKRRIAAKLAAASSLSKGKQLGQDIKQPYLQQKAELENLEKRRHELDAHEKRFELDAGLDAARHELALPRLEAAGLEGEQILSEQIRQELEGDEYAQEMPVEQ